MTCFRSTVILVALAAGAWLASPASPAQAQDGGTPPPSEPPPPPADAPTPADEEETPAEEEADDAASEPERASEPSPAPTREPTSSTRGGTTTAGGSSGTRAGSTRAPSPAPPPPAATTAGAGAAGAGAGKKDEDEIDRGAFWIEPSFGYSYIDLITFKNDNFFPSAEETQANGYTIGLALGFRANFFTIGARGNYASYPDFDLGQVLLDLGLRIPLPVVEPYIRAGLGAGWVGNTNYDALSDSKTDVWGLVAEVGAGLDFYLSDNVSIGGGVDAAFLNFSRQKCNEMTTACDVTDVNLQEDGDAVGIQVRATGHLGLHF